MSDLNTVTLTGRLTADPETRYTPTGMAINSFNLATGRKYKSKSGETREETSFIGCTAFGQQAEFIGQYLKKGTAILVQGRLKQETWDDKDTGKKQSKTKVLVEYVKSIDRRSNDDQESKQSQQTPPQRQQSTTTQPTDIGDDDVPF